MKKLSEIKEKSFDFFLTIFFLVILFILKAPCFNLPFWWDEGGHLDGAVKIIENNFNPFIEWWSYHPPLVYELVAFTYQLIGKWSIAARLIILFFSFLTLVFTYLLGKKL